MEAAHLTSAVSIVVLTHDRRPELLRTLERMRETEPAAPVYVVDNCSSDDTAHAVRRHFPQVTLIALPRNLGAAGRNHGTRAARSRYVAFCDDDTWWKKGSLARGAEILDRFPQVAAATACVLVGPEERVDPTSIRMARSPLRNPLGLPGSVVAGLMAGACIVRRDSFLRAGGYHPRLFLGAEESLLSLDLMAAGHVLAYLPELAVHHHPSSLRDARGRQQLLLRNRLWCSWMRLPAAGAVLETVRLVWRGRERTRACAAALAGLGWALRERRVVPAEVWQALRRVQRE